MFRTGKETAKTSAERAPGQKVGSTKISALEYESRASGTLSLKEPLKAGVNYYVSSVMTQGH